MFSKELESLIEAALADGILEDHEKAALVKRAKKEGVDLDELEIYIQSIMQKRQQNQKVEIGRETYAHEKLRKGNVCPHCDTPIPPMTKICPNCGRAINSNETTGDHELFELVDHISAASVRVKSATDMDSFKLAKAECESLLRKADIFYGDNKKVQMLVFDLKEEIKKAEQKLSSEAKMNTIKGFFTNPWLYVALEVIGTIIVALVFVNWINTVDYPHRQDKQSLLSLALGATMIACVSGIVSTIKKILDK